MGAKWTGSGGGAGQADSDTTLGQLADVTDDATVGQGLIKQGDGTWAGGNIGGGGGGTSDHGTLTGLADDDHTQYLRADGTRALTGDISAGSKKITSLGTPTSAADAATKGYVDGKNLTDFDPANGAVAMGGFKITGLGTPTTTTDAATKAYVDSAASGVTDHGALTGLTDDDHTQYLLKAGGTMTGAIAMGGQKITGLGTPTAGTDAVTKTYADALTGAAHNIADHADTTATGAELETLTDGSNADSLHTHTTFTSEINAGTNKIINVVDPTAAQHAATKNYVDSNFVADAGGTMSGTLNMGINKITGLAVATQSTDAINKALYDLVLQKGGGTMSGALNMGSNKITSLGTPTVATDAATKGYADGIAGGGTMSKVTSIPDGSLSGSVGQVVMQMSANSTAGYRYPIALWICEGGTSWDRLVTYTQVNSRDVGIAQNDTSTDHTSLLEEVLAQMHNDGGPGVFHLAPGAQLNVAELYWPSSVWLYGGREAQNFSHIEYAGVGGANSACLIISKNPGNLSGSGSNTNWRMADISINAGAAHWGVRNASTAYGDSFTNDFDVVEFFSVKATGGATGKGILLVTYCTNLIWRYGRMDGWGQDAIRIEAGARADIQPQTMHMDSRGSFAPRSFVSLGGTDSNPPTLFIFGNANLELIATDAGTTGNSWVAGGGIVHTDTTVSGTFGPHIEVLPLYLTGQNITQNSGGAVVAIENANKGRVHARIGPVKCGRVAGTKMPAQYLMAEHTATVDATPDASVAWSDLDQWDMGGAWDGTTFRDTMTASTRTFA